MGKGGKIVEAGEGGGVRWNGRVGLDVVKSRADSITGRRTDVQKTI